MKLRLRSRSSERQAQTADTYRSHLNYYGRALARGDYSEAAKFAGRIAILLESTDHPGALGWWETQANCRRQAGECRWCATPGEWTCPECGTPYCADHKTIRGSLCSCGRAS